MLEFNAIDNNDSTPAKLCFTIQFAFHSLADKKLYIVVVVIRSSGLRVFLITQIKSISLNVKLHLCNLQSILKEIFNISGFSTIFKTFNSEKETLVA